MYKSDTGENEAGNLGYQLYCQKWQGHNGCDTHELEIFGDAYAHLTVKLVNTTTHEGAVRVANRIINDYGKTINGMLEVLESYDLTENGLEAVKELYR